MTELPREGSRAERALDAMALRLIEEHMGPEFMQHAYDSSHWISAWAVVNTAPWVRSWRSWFAQALLSVHSAPGFERLRPRLRRRWGFDEARTVLRPAALLAQAGCRIELEPAVRVGSGLRYPDLRFDVPGVDCTVLCEVSRSQEAACELAVRESGQFVVDAVMSPAGSIKARGALLRVLLPDEQDSIAELIKATIRDAAESRSPCALRIDGALELTVVHQSVAQRFEPWASDDRGNTLELDAPDPGVDHVHRARVKIASKMRQIPRGAPAVLVLYHGDLVARTKTDLSLVEDLEPELHRFPGLLAVAFVGGTWGPESVDCTLERTEHAFVERPSPQGGTDATLFVANSRCEVPGAADVSAAIRVALTAQPELLANGRDEEDRDTHSAAGVY